MSISKQPSGGFRAVVKINGRYVVGRTFASRREAAEWERQNQSLVRLGVDLKASRQPLEDFVVVWLGQRQMAVAYKTLKSDTSIIKWIPVWLLRTPVGSIRTGMISKVMEDLASEGMARSSLYRFRATLSSLFRWCKDNGLLLENPTRGAVVPRSAARPREMHPFARKELISRLKLWRDMDPDAAAVVEFLASTGCRWSEARELKSEDVLIDPHLALWITRVSMANPNCLAWPLTHEHARKAHRSRGPKVARVEGYRLQRTSLRGWSHGSPQEIPICYLSGRPTLFGDALTETRRVTAELFTTSGTRP
jgi:integrase